MFTVPDYDYIQQTTSDIYAHVTKDMNIEATNILYNSLYEKNKGECVNIMPQSIVITCCEISYKPDYV